MCDISIGVIVGQGLFPLLDDKTPTKSDKQWVNECNKAFGKKKTPQGWDKAKSKAHKQASRFYFGDRREDHIFTVVHFAGNVKYNALEFVAKNADKLPGQLTEMMKMTSSSFIKTIGYDPDAKEKKKKGKQTLASKYCNQLADLSDTLTSTNPHYLRCLKPNDIHCRPVDGMGSFDAAKTYVALHSTPLCARFRAACADFNEGFLSDCPSLRWAGGAWAGTGS